MKLAHLSHPCFHELCLPMKATKSMKHKSGEFTWHKYHSFQKLLGIPLDLASDAETPK